MVVEGSFFRNGPTLTTRGRRMRKQMNVRLLFLSSFVLMLAISLLAGCSSAPTDSTSSTVNTSTSAGDQNSSSADKGSDQKTGEDAAAYYKGKKIEFIVPYAPSGGYNDYARMMAPFLSKYTGADVQVVNIEGAGGMLGANELFMSPSDGLRIGILNGSALVSNEIAGVKGARYKLSEFEYLGRVVSDPRVMVMGSNSPYQTIDDVLNSEQQVRMGATGLGGSTYVDAVLTKYALDLNATVIHGFDTLVDPAILRGEVDGQWGSWGSRRTAVENGDMVPVLVGGEERLEDLPDVPTIYEVIGDDPTALGVLDVWNSLIEVGRPIVTVPGIPEDRLQFLRTAFKQVMEDPEFIAQAEQSERDLLYKSGEEMAEIVKKATIIEDPGVKDIVIKAINGKL